MSDHQRKKGKQIGHTLPAISEYFQGDRTEKDDAPSNLSDDAYKSLKEFIAEGGEKDTPHPKTPRILKERSLAKEDYIENEIQMSNSTKKRLHIDTEASLQGLKRPRNSEEDAIQLTSFPEMIDYNAKYSVKVTIAQLWHGQYYGKNLGIGITMLAQDQKANRMEIVLSQSSAAKWASSLIEHQSYLIIGVVLLRNQRSVKLVDRDYQLTFDEQTTVNELPLEQIPLSSLYDFKNLSAIKDLFTRPNTLRDFMLYVLDIHHPTVRTRVNKAPLSFVEAYVIDRSLPNLPILLTIWDDTCKKYLEYFTKGSKQFVTAVTGLRISNFNKELYLGTTPFTRFTFQVQNFPATRQLIERLTEVAADLSIASPDSQIAHAKRLQLPQEPITTIEQIFSSLAECPIPGKKLEFTTKAIIMFVYTEEGITYTSCISCSKSMKSYGQHISCPNPNCDNKHGATKDRFRMKISVKDTSASAKLTLFDKDAEYVLGFSADEAIEIRNKEPNGMLCLQQKVHKAIGREFKFRLKIDHNNYSYAMKREFTVQSLTWLPKAFTSVELSHIEDAPSYSKAKDTDDDNTPEPNE